MTDRTHGARLFCIGFCLVSFFFGANSFAQVYTNKEIGKKNAEKIDSLKHSEYPYSLPILGKKATKAGYTLPYSAGISAQVFSQKSDLIIENLKVGFNGGPMYDLDGLVRFDKAIASASAITIRPDIWLLPFLNIYGIIGKSSASTDIGFGVWVPDSTGSDQEIITSETNVKFNATTVGLGMTPTIGVGGGFLALDLNVAWTDVPQLSKPAMTFVFGPRLGKSINLKKPGRAVALWAGGFRVHLNSGTYGSLDLSEVLPTDQWQEKVDNGIVKLDQVQQNINTWWNNLTPVEQAKPVNKARYELANNAIDRTAQLLANADYALNDGESSTVQYSMDKRPKDKWNFIVGSQYQLNRHFMLRTEVGFLASRTQVIAGLQYRFGL